MSVDYRSRTIDKRPGARTRFYTPPRPDLRSRSDPSPRPWIHRRPGRLRRLRRPMGSSWRATWSPWRPASRPGGVIPPSPTSTGGRPAPTRTGSRHSSRSPIRRPILRSQAESDLAGPSAARNCSSRPPASTPSRSTSIPRPDCSPASTRPGRRRRGFRYVTQERFMNT